MLTSKKQVCTYNDNNLSTPVPPLLQAVELLVPAIIMLLIGSIKNSLTTEKLGAATPTTDSPVITYEAMQSVNAFPNVVCYDNNMFMRYESVLPELLSQGIFKDSAIENVAIRLPCLCG